MVDRTAMLRYLAGLLKSGERVAGDQPSRVQRNDALKDLLRVGFGSAATVLRRQGRLVLHSAGIAVGERLHRIVQQPATEGVPQPHPLDHPVRGQGGHRRLQTRAQPPPPAFGPGLPNAGRVRCGVQAHPHPGHLRDQLNLEPDNQTLNPTQYRGLARSAGLPH
jgi:hypothetical protein